MATGSDIVNVVARFEFGWTDTQVVCMAAALCGNFQLLVYQSIRGFQALREILNIGDGGAIAIWVDRRQDPVELLSHDRTSGNLG